MSKTCKTKKNEKSYRMCETSVMVSVYNNNNLEQYAEINWYRSIPFQLILKYSISTDKLEQSSEQNLTMNFLRQKAQNNGARFNIKGTKLLFIKTIFVLLVNHHFLWRDSPI